MKTEIEKFFDLAALDWDKNDKFSEEIKMKLLSRLHISKDDFVLDVGCGTGVTTFLLSDFTNEKVLGIDISGNMIKIAKTKYKNLSRVKFLHKDIFEKDSLNKYDMVLLYNAYPHFLEPKKLSKKLFSLLKRNGRFAIVHSFNIDDLNKHHENIPNRISRKINSLDEEAKYFEPYFKIEIMENNPHSIYLVGRKI